MIPAVTTSALKDYVAEIKKNLSHDPTEHSHRPALKTLIESFGHGIVATNDPKRMACGAPDFKVTRNAVPLGYIETKDIGKNLNSIEKGKGKDGEQFRRFVEAPLSNFILTDYLEFRWYVDGKSRLVARVATVDAQGALALSPSGESELVELLAAFLQEQSLTIGTSKELAQRLSGMARMVRKLILKTYDCEKEDGWLHGWLNAFREALIPDLDSKKFADMFAQTLCYGLFAARVHALKPADFSRQNAAFDLPKTNPFLRKLFAEFAGVSMPDEFAWVVDDLVELLRHTSMSDVLKDFGSGKGKEDPVLHFYETFLESYDPKLREIRGVYYTPEPVVRYIVRSVDALLRECFDKPKGLADTKTLILDPAVGTATFLFFVIQTIQSEFKGQKGAWSSYVGEHLLNRLFGFELLMAPYAIAHLKLGTELKATGYEFGLDQRLGIYLTNTLEEAVKKSEKWFKFISDEANDAAAIKRDLEILIVLGNPPYSGHSANRSFLKREVQPGETYAVRKGGPLRSQMYVAMKTARKRQTVKEKTFIGNLMEDYYFVDDLPLGEKNPKWLQDDYVKFIRFAQWRIDRTGYGILAFITNHGYLENPTFRGMRQNLLRDFSELHVFNLHGNSKRRERSPDGSEDKNVFDIQQGVAILLAVKLPGNSGVARVFHADLWGPRKKKYDVLDASDVSTTSWAEIKPSAPQYLFVPQDQSLLAEYEKGWRLTDAMPLNSLGVVTARDSLTIQFTSEEVKKTIERFVELDPEDARSEFRLGEDKRDWSVVRAQADLRKSKLAATNVVPILYRPFDIRYTYYTGNSRGFHCMPRREVMGHMIQGDNISLLGTRSIEIDKVSHIFCSRTVAGHHSVSIKEVDYIFPLYKHSKQDSAQAELAGMSGKIPNLKKEFLSAIAGRLGLEQDMNGLPQGISADDIVYYIYGILHSPMYRARYYDLLQRDFWRVPLVSKPDLFAQLATFGKELTDLHTLQSPLLDQLTTTFPETGDNTVRKYTFDISQKVWINDVQYFGGFPKSIWDFEIGGYQVCKQWLKDRKDRSLSYSEIEHFQRTVVAIRETIRVMAEIDKLTPSWPLE